MRELQGAQTFLVQAETAARLMWHIAHLLESFEVEPTLLGINIEEVGVHEVFIYEATVVVESM